MRKLSTLLIIALIAASCSTGTYYPYARNHFGAQSTVVLDKANFRVVRNVEAIVSVNNTRLSREDIANSAYGELLRKAQLTGSQVLINVVIEEVTRVSPGFFLPKKIQHVAARATIIEFLDENGNPTVSPADTPSGTHQTTTTINQQTVDTGDIQKCERIHGYILKLSKQYPGSRSVKKYNNLYYTLPRTQENAQTLIKIQSVVVEYLKSYGASYPNIEKQLKHTSSLEEDIEVFLSYYHK